MFKAWIVVVLLAGAVGCVSTTQALVASEQPATIALSQQYTLTSKATGRTYVVQVSAPLEPPAPGEKAAAVYVMDGNWYFGIATDTARMLAIGGGMTPTYIVAVGYSDPTHKSVVANRETDLAHVRFTGPEGSVGGGGAAFADFLTEQLKPFVEARYPVDPAQAYLAGQSLGGLFATNVLLKAPDSFQGYLIGSPSLWADPSVLPAAATFSAGGGKHVFIGVGGNESSGMRAGAAALAKALSAPSTGLNVVHREFADLMHQSMQGSWFAKGLSNLLDR
ncbi:MAG: alpha/beta hydrolase-fold protein [Hyphomonadaceae bacterium]